ncbi:SDR family NAD(P)-dependent oxidoreductase [Capillimicrobium parvum]|uniref:Dihydroanticapsin 7-dehydrogenase n=1 Tax=Capillimicrobium parvum TaxID=2884022 RepID=A0A9E7C6M6_9ACTN|nr:SDR family oxidoreductase [Capillimicrobium parvum]UGS39074.1 Dihydroanticapsin 7-dehydrogenase [Capillimicrobium parvum]
MAPTALITGGGTGIGAAVARRMAADGFSVCVAGRRPEPLEALAAEVGGRAVVADVADPAGPAAAVAGAVERFGRLDALVCCAGTGAGGTVAEQTLERWERVLATNLTGVFLTCRAALPHLVEARGAIVTVASLAGLRAAPASAAYGASKAGAIMLTQCIAVDHGPQGVRANCVCPGWIRTEMADRAMDELGGLRGTGRDGAYELATAPVPARRPGEPDEVAGLVAWLAGPQSTYVNGAVVTVDGGSAVVDAASLAFGP